MPAKLHLAEDALTLHLLLQHLERLIDIVVTDENLHGAPLWIRACPQLGEHFTGTDQNQTRPNSPSAEFAEVGLRGPRPWRRFLYCDFRVRLCHETEKLRGSNDRHRSVV